MKALELRHLFERAEASWRCALAERRAKLSSGSLAVMPEIVGEIRTSAERIEAALDTLFNLRAAYVFDRNRDEVRVPIEDLMNLLLEADFA